MVNSKSSSWNIVERLCFPAPRASYTIKSFPDELILIPGGFDGRKVPCLFLPFRHARFLIIYFHANAEDLGLCYTFCTIVRDLFQVHMLAVEYPGYGICPGHCDEEPIMANANAAFRFATETLHWPCDGIKLLGRSLGTGPAMALAARHEVAGVALVAPFISIREIFRNQVGTVADLVKDRFRNVECAAQIESPTLIIHGQQDTLIPLAHSKAIYEALPSKKMMVCPALMGHNTSLLANVGTFVLPMTQFFSLPDYTFEDIEVPDWVFPDAGSISERRKPQDEAEGGGGADGESSREATASRWRRTQSGPGASDRSGEGGSEAGGQRRQLGLGAPVLGGAASAPAAPGAGAGRATLLQATRNYDFRSPPSTPRDPSVVDREHSGQRGAASTPQSRTNSRAVFSEEMLNTIEMGISWLVDTDNDVCMLGKEPTGTGPVVPPRTLLQGAPHELSERLAVPGTTDSDTEEPVEEATEERLPPTPALEVSTRTPRTTGPRHGFGGMTALGPGRGNISVRCQQPGHGDREEGALHAAQGDLDAPTGVEDPHRSGSPGAESSTAAPNSPKGPPAEPVAATPVTNARGQEPRPGNRLASAAAASQSPRRGGSGRSPTGTPDRGPPHAVLATTVQSERSGATLQYRL